MTGPPHSLRPTTARKGKSPPALTSTFTSNSFNLLFHSDTPSNLLLFSQKANPTFFILHSTPSRLTINAGKVYQSADLHRLLCLPPAVSKFRLFLEAVCSTSTLRTHSLLQLTSTSYISDLGVLQFERISRPVLSSLDTSIHLFQDVTHLLSNRLVPHFLSETGNANPRSGELASLPWWPFHY